MNPSEYAGFNWVNIAFSLFFLAWVCLLVAFLQSTGKLARTVAFLSDPTIIAFLAALAAALLAVFVGVRLASFAVLRSRLKAAGEVPVAFADASLSVATPARAPAQFSQLKKEYFDAVVAVTENGSLAISPTIAFTRRVFRLIPRDSIVSIDCGAFRLYRGKNGKWANAWSAGGGSAPKQVAAFLGSWLPVDRIRVQVGTRKGSYLLLMRKKNLGFLKALIERAA